LKADPELWSGCVSGAFHELELLSALEEADFYGIAIDKWEHEPFAVVEGIEFRSVTITARKGMEAESLDANEAVIYRGPWRSVEDDDGHKLIRGERTAVDSRTFRVLSDEPYATEIVALPPHTGASPVAYDCCRDRLRHPRETKGAGYRATRKPGEGSCC
jgi:hypothetical protein